MIFFMQILNCKLEFFNPEDHLWGMVGQNSTTGFYYELVEEKIDIIIGCQYFTHWRAQVFENISSK